MDFEGFKQNSEKLWQSKLTENQYFLTGILQSFQLWCLESYFACLFGMLEFRNHLEGWSFRLGGQVWLDSRFFGQSWCKEAGLPPHFCFSSVNCLFSLVAFCFELSLPHYFYFYTLILLLDSITNFVSISDIDFRCMVFATNHHF